MARTINRLSARTVAVLKEPGLHADGGGLYLRVDTGGAKRWTFLYRWEGRRREMGLGPVRDLSLAEAREHVAGFRRQVRDGADPIAARRTTSPAAPTFGAVADALLAELEPGWKHPAHRRQWRLHLIDYAAPLRDRPVAAITTDEVMAVLRPLWTERPESASRVRARIERVLDAAKARGLREGENPARWKGHLALLLPKPNKLARGHHAALPYAEAPDFAARLRAADGMGARALEFVLLTLGRESEVLGAAWEEVDGAARVWTVPAARTKTGTEHRVPLCPAALTLLDRVAPEGERVGLIFPGARGKPLSNATMDAVFDRMGLRATPHGLRSTFRDWAGDETGFSREVAEAALAHKVGGAVEQAYRRGDALAKRRRLMDCWGVYLAGDPLPDSVRAA